MTIKAFTSSRFMKHSKKSENEVSISATWTRTPFPNKIRPSLYMTTEDGYKFNIELTFVNAKLLVADLQKLINDLAIKYPHELED